MINLYQFDRDTRGVQYKFGTVPDYKVSPAENARGGVELSNSFIKKMLAQKVKIEGDKLANNNRESEAVYFYEEAILIWPGYPSPYYNLAKVYEKTGEFDRAINTYTRLLEVKPDEAEAQTLIGKIFKRKGDYTTARQMYNKALEIDPKYDFAARSLKEIDYLILAGYKPQEAEALKQQESEKNLEIALKLVERYAPPGISRAVDEIDIVFNETDTLSGHKNIAQYEHHNRKIVITSDYIWASPQVTAAYIIHEAVHAKDKDAISSIKEEQDAYEESINFWRAHNKGIKDPELDYAADLYRESPQKLRKKVGETYRARDESMPEYSPYHTQNGNLGMLASLKIQTLKLRSQASNMLGLY